MASRAQAEARAGRASRCPSHQYPTPREPGQSPRPGDATNSLGRGLARRASAPAIQLGLSMKQSLAATGSGQKRPTTPMPTLGPSTALRTVGASWRRRPRLCRCAAIGAVTMSSTVPAPQQARPPTERDRGGAPQLLPRRFSDDHDRHRRAPNPVDRADRAVGAKVRGHAERQGGGGLRIGHTMWVWSMSGTRSTGRPARPSRRRASACA